MSDLINTNQSHLTRQALSKDIEHINLLVDCSGSMSATFGSTTRILAAKRGVDQIIRSSSKKRTHFSLTTFTHHAQTAVSRTDKFIKILMLKFYTDGGTDMLMGLREAYNQEPQRIIVLSDGDTSYQHECLEFVRANLPRGIKIDTIAIGEANDVFLRQLSELTGGTFFRAESPELLEQHYNKLESKNYLQLTHQG